MSGFVIGAFTGLIFGITLFILARVIGYSRLVNGVWVEPYGEDTPVCFIVLWIVDGYSVDS